MRQKKKQSTSGLEREVAMACPGEKTTRGTDRTENGKIAGLTVWGREGAEKTSGGKGGPR